MRTTRSTLAEEQRPAQIGSSVESLRAALERDRHGFRALASARLRKLDVRLHSTRSAHGNEGADDHSASAGSYACAARSPPAKRFALYDAAEAQARFERATLRSLRHILSTCLQIEALSLECMPRALEQLSPRPASSLSVSSAASQAKRLQEERSQQRQLDVLASRVRHLSCHLSVYAGQFNDAFWAPTPSPSTSPSNGRWAALTHLQLYGPRFRFTEATARALASLPSLEQLALIMPLVVQQGNNATGLEGGAGVDDGDDAVSWSDASFDLAGRRNVLQTLVSGARRLRLLLVVGHDNRQYVGWTDRYRPWLRALHRPRPSLRSRSSTSNEEVYGGEAGTAASPSLSLLRIQLLTARERGSGAEEEAATRMTTSRAAHPSLFGRWMMDRTERGRQWSFEPGWSPVKEGDAGHEGDGEGRDVDGDIEFSVEAWDAQQTELVSPDVDRDGDRDGDGFGSTPSPRRTRAAPPPSLVLAAAEQRGEEEVWGIDNLD
ncbi:uncharacterized protein PFL1_02137 [Pseudozyma flocculosa PF-1]|uniref:uncharacterized protein n=1 Tax=Pseudozyma flocculosa PF-1 TaxID=1277687 RepID=UPI00045613ED|nr:uncharacterized protein PFL1_02137 [Pseudozyma flocculosa PF-1]EPQ30613.1 hypothetical protein PFL1_02137 [Pseudozyma flocculosa PF-1]